MFFFLHIYSFDCPLAIAVHNRIGGNGSSNGNGGGGVIGGNGNGNGGDVIGIAAGVNVGQPVPPQIQPQQPAQPQALHQQPPMRLSSVDRDTNAGTNYPAEENKCYKVSVSFDR